jgi:glutamine synthetase
VVSTNQAVDETNRDVGDETPTDVTPTELVALVHGDLVGHCRGKAVPASDLRRRLERGIGWTPGNLALDPFGVIAEGNPFGAVGDLQLRPVPETRVRVVLDGAPPLHLYLCDLYDAEGGACGCCPRTVLAAALEELRRSGLELIAAFEHEFSLLPEDVAAGGAFSLSRLRGAEPFPTRVVEALAEAGCEPESLIAEYGSGQFEVTCGPSRGLTAADRALVLREVVREVARRCGRRATFTPLWRPDGVGNGLHIHLSFRDEDGRPATHDPSGPGELSPVAAAFAAGVLAHLPALCALTAPSPISYWRLQPGRWSAARATCAVSDREATLRLPAALTNDPRARASRCNLEFRAADATASPHLALAGLIRAGLDGIDQDLELPRPASGLTRRDPGEPVVAISGSLPPSLDGALRAFDGDSTIGSWFAHELRECYLAVKRQELHSAANQDRETTCQRYADAY